jgi:hypothetical protein
MKKILNIVPENPELVLIALNPTEEAIANNSVFSRDEAFWNLLIQANILKVDVKNIDLKCRAKRVFQFQESTNIRLGFADLLPLEIEKKSNNVKIPKDAAISLLNSCENLQKTKKIALLGEKVVNAFAKEFNLINWDDMKKKGSQNRFSEIGEITINNNKIKIFAMPFPINNSIKDKHEYYKKLI